MSVPSRFRFVLKALYINSPCHVDAAAGQGVHIGLPCLSWWLTIFACHVSAAEAIEADFVFTVQRKFFSLDVLVHGNRNGSVRMGFWQNPGRTQDFFFHRIVFVWFPA